MEEAVSAAETRASGMDKIKNRMNEEVEDLLLDLEKVGVVFVFVRNVLYET